jgi:putative serine protease PepD
MTDEQGWPAPRHGAPHDTSSQPAPPQVPQPRQPFGLLPTSPHSGFGPQQGFGPQPQQGFGSPARPGFGSPASQGLGYPSQQGFGAPPPAEAPFGMPHYPAEPAPKRRRIGRTVAAVIGVIALSGGSAVAGGYTALQFRSETSQTIAAAATTRTAANAKSLAGVAAAVLPSVVSIQTGSAVGSGVIITSDGSILTNNHVAATARGSSVQVTFSTGKTATATIVGTDTANDLAVIKVANISGLTPLVFGDSTALHVGDTVLAVGSPLGLDGSVTAGIVSALNRTIDIGNTARSSTSLSGAIQTDAAINPGNSGGALVNSAGELVGINTAIATSGQDSGSIGVGFAISSNTARQVAQRLMHG